MFSKRKIFLFTVTLAIILAPYVVLGQWDVSKPVDSNLPESTVGDIVKKVTNWILGFIATVAVLVLVWGGVRYVTALGDESAVEEAKNIITQAIIGLVIVGIAYAAVVVVVNRWIGIN